MLSNLHEHVAHPTRGRKGHERMNTLKSVIFLKLKELLAAYLISMYKNVQQHDQWMINGIILKLMTVLILIMLLVYASLNVCFPGEGHTDKQGEEGSDPWKVNLQGLSPPQFHTSFNIVNIVYILVHMHVHASH